MSELTLDALRRDQASAPPEPVDLAVVLPNDHRADPYLIAGFKPGRCNAHTVTMIKRYPSVDAAERVARRIGFIWCIDRVRQ